MERTQEILAKNFKTRLPNLNQKNFNLCMIQLARAHKRAYAS